MKTNNEYLKKYKLQSAKQKDIDILIRYKLSNIFEYANNLSIEEINQINKYVKDEVPNQIDNYKVIIIDELYIEEKYRNSGIGTKLISNVICNNKVVYLRVYKLNVNAIRLYKRLGFKIIKETESRHYMKFNE